MAPLDEVASLAHLAAIVEGSDDAIVSKDLDGRILSWNRGAQQMFGYTAAEAIGKPMTILFPAGREGEEDAILANIRAGHKVDHYETVRRRKDGRLIDVSVTVSPIRDATGRVVAASKVARDITHRKRAEEALRHSNERLRQLDDERREMLNAVAHELLTPLTPILLQLQYLRELGADPERLARSLELMDRNLKRLHNLVRQVLDVARLDWQKRSIRRSDTDLCVLLGECAETYRPAAERAGIRLDLECPGALPAALDPDRITQVLHNLLSNALKFTLDGGRILIHAEARASPAGPAVHVAVTDTGLGFTADQRRRMFQPFYRGHDRPGTGLGLYISKAIVELHGGELTADSAGPGQGARMAFWLPVVAPAAH
ncbi:MAG: hypothetical protein QOD77_1782 [Thermoplasmata archaeon]|jgi:PAS domain S-box-containing protein|nr:hypothetical protein [Thermoplasmata archaeon]